MNGRVVTGAVLAACLVVAQGFADEGEAAGDSEVVAQGLIGPTESAGARPRVNITTDPVVPLLGAVLLRGPAGILGVQVRTAERWSLGGYILGAAFDRRMFGARVVGRGMGAGIETRYCHYGVFRTGPYLTGGLRGIHVDVVNPGDSPITGVGDVGGFSAGGGFQWFAGRFNLGVEGTAQAWLGRIRFSVGEGDSRVSEEAWFPAPGINVAFQVGYAL